MAPGDLMLMSLDIVGNLLRRVLVQKPDRTPGHRASSRGPGRWDGRVLIIQLGFDRVEVLMTAGITVELESILDPIPVLRFVSGKRTAQTAVGAIGGKVFFQAGRPVLYRTRAEFFIRACY